MAAPVAMAAYALAGTSRQLVVSATTATSAVSAATVGPLAGGDVERFAALSAALALVVGVVLVARRRAALRRRLRPRVQARDDRLPVRARARHRARAAPGAARRRARRGELLPGAVGRARRARRRARRDAGGRRRLAGGPRRSAGGWCRRCRRRCVVLVLAIAVSAIAGLEDHGVDVVGDIPNALPDPAIPDVSADDSWRSIAPALGVLILSAEAVGVARALAVKHGYRVDPNRDLVAMGASNALAGLSSGFVQSGGASQTAAADGAGGRSQLAIAGRRGPAPADRRLPGAAVRRPPAGHAGGDRDRGRGGLLRRREMRRYARVRRSAVVFAGLALAGVLVLGVLQGLIVAAGLALVYVVARFSRRRYASRATRPAPGAATRPRRRARRPLRRPAPLSERQRRQGPRARARRRSARRRARPRGLDRARRPERRHAGRAGRRAAP